MLFVMCGHSGPPRWWPSLVCRLSGVNVTPAVDLRLMAPLHP